MKHLRNGPLRPAVEAFPGPHNLLSITCCRTVHLGRPRKPKARDLTHENLSICRPSSRKSALRGWPIPLLPLRRFPAISKVGRPSQCDQRSPRIALPAPAAIGPIPRPAVLSPVRRGSDHRARRTGDLDNSAAPGAAHGKTPRDRIALPVRTSVHPPSAPGEGRAHALSAAERWLGIDRSTISCRHPSPVANRACGRSSGIARESSGSGVPRTATAHYSLPTHRERQPIRNYIWFGRRPVRN